MTDLRAGVIGLGAMGRHHARVLGSMPGVSLVGVADASPAARAEAPACTVTAHLEELLPLGLDLCVVAVPTRRHTEIGLELARAGVHTLIEKPLAATVTDGSALADAFERAGLVGCVGHVERYNPVLRALRCRVWDGDLGRLFQIATSRQGPYPDRIRDVGVVLDLASHDIDLTRWIAGSPYLKVSAYTTRSMARQHEDLASVAGVLRDGTVISHLVNWLSPLKERTVTVTGERGCLRADLLAKELWFQRGDLADDGPAADRTGEPGAAGLSRCPVAWQEPLRTELENFRDAVLGKDADIVTMRQGTDVLEVASAVLATVPGTRPAVPIQRSDSLVLPNGSSAFAARAVDVLVPAALWRT
jgi:UDP-N-acetylglucosamine 3-dehydrogenase